MADDFKVIETQEEFDNAIKSRLERERSKFAEQLAGIDDLKNQLAESQKQVSDLNTALNAANEKISAYDGQIAERDIKIKAYESFSVKTRIASELGLSHEAIDFLQGENEEEIRKSAETLKNLVGVKTAPLASGEPTVTPQSKTDAGLKAMVASLNNND